MEARMRAIVLGVGVSVAAAAAAAQDHQACPMHAQHQSAVDQRHEVTTGVPSDATRHQFVVTKEGGQIRLDAKDGDEEARRQVRKHLQAIARSFSAGDFGMPMAVHDQVPPGVEVMKDRRAAIRYRYEKTPNGALVSIATTDAEALDAVHQFLRFQILDHGTGDPIDPQ
jgi:hypothetical protein